MHCASCFRYQYVRNRLFWLLVCSGSRDFTIHAKEKFLLYFEWMPTSNFQAFHARSFSLREYTEIGATPSNLERLLRSSPLAISFLGCLSPSR